MRICIMTLVLAAALAAGGAAEDSAVEPVNLYRAAFAWDAPATNVDGSPCADLASYELALSAAEVDLRSGGEPLELIAVPASQLQGSFQAVADLPEGRLRAWVRAVDDAGNPSEWAGPLELLSDAVSPGAPGRLRVEVRVTVVIE